MPVMSTTAKSFFNPFRVGRRNSNALALGSAILLSSTMVARANALALDVRERTASLHAMEVTHGYESTYDYLG